MIKLIDFGFFDPNNLSYFTPEFAEPSLLDGKRATCQSDFYALEKIINHMKRQLCPMEHPKGRVESPTQIDSTSRGWRRRALAKLVSEQLLLRNKKTQVVSISEEKMKRSLGLRLAVSLFVGLTVLLLFMEETTKAQGQFQVKGRSHWVQFSMNKGALRFGPTQPNKLRAGQYTVLLQSPKGHEQREIRISPNGLFVLQP